MARWRTPAASTLLVKPLTMMNLSGEAAGALLRYFRIAIEDMLVVTDDVALPVGRLRARARGSAGTSAPTRMRGCAWGWGGETSAVISPITCSRSSTRPSGR